MIPPIVFAASILLVCALVTLPRFAVAQMTTEIIEAAKKEREMIFYGAVTVNISKRITDRFEKKYGIAVKHWRRDASETVNRVATEARAGRRRST
ncbi:MAG TPA: hypothetical protein VGW77_36105 [Candidatus Binatia bacterium]|jgi:ABC-type uncharacterized transport system YnjBCD substrate-binding protein|nr:hypothetical protein [Candidatus Binatia bacterium]